MAQKVKRYVTNLFMPANLKAKNVTSDNGKEFAQYKIITLQSFLLMIVCQDNEA